MFFELTDRLTDSILFSMEDQNCSWMLDAESAALIPQKLSDRNSEEYSSVPEDACVDDERYYSLPEWTSSDGFELLENFTNNLHSPMARAELKNVLVSGRGVFRNFKNVLKAYPEVERKWHFYKTASMKERLMEWYNALRESWGLERLEFSEIEEVDELIQNDFVFTQYSSESDWKDIQMNEGVLVQEFKKQFDGEVGQAFASLWEQLSLYAESDSKYGFVCRSQTDEFTGCILTALCPKDAKKTVCITDFFVLPNYRGLGIGRQLFSNCIEGLRKNGIRWVLIANTVIPEAMEPLFIQSGFVKTGTGFVADLCAEA